MPTLNRTHQGIVNPLEYGTALNSTTLSAALSVIGSTRAYLMIPAVDRVGTPGAWSLTSNVTIPPNVTLMVAGGAQLNIATGVTITCQGSVQAGQWQWINLTGTGKILFPNADEVFPQWWGAKGDGSTIDRTAVQHAFNACKTVAIPDGTYYMGQAAVLTNFIDLSALGAEITIRTGKNVEFVCETTANTTPRFFFMQGNSHFHCGPIRFRDIGYDHNVTWRGAWGFYLFTPVGASWGDVTFEAIYGNRLVGPITIDGAVNLSDRIRGVHIGQIFADDCYYGFSAQNNGDGVTIDQLITYQNYRPYIVYGVNGHKVNIFNRLNRNSSGAVNIARLNGGLNTVGIKVRYVAIDQNQNMTHVLVNHIDLLGGVIHDLDIDVSIASSVPYRPVRFVNYNGSAVETSAASSNNVRDIRLRGSCDGNALPVACGATYASKGQMTFEPGFFFTYESAIPDRFFLNGPVLRNQFNTWAWTGVTTNPAIGNGEFLCNLDIVGGMAFLHARITMGSTTTYGSGGWSIGNITNGGFILIPGASALGSVWMHNEGVVIRTGVARMLAGISQITMYVDDVGPAVQSTVPFTWGTGDVLEVSIAFPFTS